MRSSLLAFSFAFAFSFTSGAEAASPTPLTVAPGTGAAATAAADASKAAAEILKRGGNAVDGAVAAALALGVVDPESSGLGGGGFAVYWSAKDKRAYVLDFRDAAPAAATRDMYLVDGKLDPARPKVGGLAIAVPGEPAGLAELERKYGRLGLPKVVAPAERLARLGFAAPRHLVDALAESDKDAKKAPVDQLFLRPGAPIVVGTRLKRPALARSLARFGRKGDNEFYQGAIARALVAGAAKEGGALTLADLAGYKPIWRQPLVGHYRGHDLLGAPPPAGGLTAIEALQILDARPPLGPLGQGSSAANHQILEALKHAFADRARSLGDPAFVEVPTERLASPGYAVELAHRVFDEGVLSQKLYGDALAPSRPADEAHDHGTSHLCVVDGEGNVVAMTTTVNLYFGARVVGGDSGVLLNDSMDDFSAQPGVPNAFGLVGSTANAIAAGKRPLSSMTPLVVARDGRAVLCAGAAGGPMIISATVQTVVNVLDFDLDVQAAVSAPRVHAQWAPDLAFVEADTARDVIDGLKRRGHKVSTRAKMAAAQSIKISPTSVTAASDPRYGGQPAAPSP